MSRSRSEETASSDPLRPSDHIDGEDSTVASPRLSALGWMRWGWRQLTSMRTALILLLVLAVAAIPGSIFPQRTADPNGVTQWQVDNPDLFPVIDALSLFDVYLSPWFSAIYLLLFVSLIGCVIPRIRHHLTALRSRPPRTPARLSRLSEHHQSSRPLPDGADAAEQAEHAVAVAQRQLRSLGYRVARYDSAGTFSVSAERGYARESGNLVFHLALVGVLVAVGIGGGFAYTGQRVIVEGQSFVNTLLDYESMNRGRFVADDALRPYALSLESFEVTYEEFGTAASGQAGNFVANIQVREDGSERAGTVRVNHPLAVGGDRVYLLGNGYAPTLTVRNGEGVVVYHNAVPFLPQDTNMTSLGVIKVPDGAAEQLGLVGFFYPTAGRLNSGAFTSVFGDLYGPLLTLDVYAGDLGIDDGTPRSVYTLDTTDMERLTGNGTDLPSLTLQPGQSAELPGGRGTVTFDDVSPAGAEDARQSVKRFVSLQIHRDDSAVWVLVFALLSLGGLMLALFVPRRRMWVKARAEGDGIQLEYAGLARGEDPTLASAVEDLAVGHARLLDHSSGPGPSRPGPDPRK